MATLRSLLRRQFSKFVGGVVATDRRLAGCARRSLALERLESRDLFSVNPIVAENQLPGTAESVWDVPGAGDATIQGFATDISVNQGQTIGFKINDTKSAPYHIDIYRLGYYQGLGARLVSTIPSSQNFDVVQPSPKVDPNTDLVDAGNWSVTSSWAVPATATSGVYFARVQRDDTHGAFMILFIVRADSSHSQVLFQTDDSTWQAYNTWGGYSLYTYTNGKAGPGAGGAAYAVSYNRPLIDRGTAGGLGATNNFFYDEYPMVRWLEANGYDVSYFTNVDADRSGSLIQNHQVYVTTGHDEYWSGNQMANVMAARDAGVNLIFTSGNDAFWKTYYSPSIDGSSTAYRTLVCYKETHQNAITDPNNPNIWTGTWMDPRFSPPADGGRPQNQLTGTLFTVNRGPNDTGTPITVPYSDAQLRFWRNTSVAQLQPGQTATLGDYELGYEWNEDVDNGFRPAGLIDMSSTTENVTQKFIDYGNTTAAGVATNSMTLYRAKSGALVFSAGMVQYNWGLDGNHDDENGVFGFNSAPVPALQQATVNLLADMYVQPGSLQPGLVGATASTDVVPPKSTIKSPLGGANLGTGTTVTVTGTASDSGGGVVAGVEVSVDGGRTWHPATGTTTWSYTWIPDTPGQVTILSRAADDSGNIETPSGGVTVSVAFQATSRTGLVGEYGFNDGTGTTLSDSSGDKNNGTISNATWVAGLSGSALSFNGANSWVTIPNSASLQLTNAMTLEAWVKPNSLTGASSILMKEMTGGLSYALYAANDGPAPPVAAIDAAGTDVDAISTANLQTGVWSHLAATYDGSNLKLYVNGNVVGSIGATGLLSTSTGALRIGGNSVWGEFFSGLIDDVRVYNRALNQAEIRSDMSSPIGGVMEKTVPAVAVTSPAAGATISGSTTLSASASDAVVVTSVQFLLDGQPLGAPVTSAPYTLNWNSQTVPNGTHTLSSIAVNGAGLTATAVLETVTVNNPPDTVPPTVKVGTPANGAFASGLTVLQAVASDNIAVTSVQFQLNGTSIGPLMTTAPYRTAVDFSSFASGTYSLTAVATDAANNQTDSTAVTITVDHVPPTISSVSPPAGSTNVSTASTFAVTFSEPVQPATISASLKDSAGNNVPMTVSYNDATESATFTHGTIALDPLTAYTVTVSGVRDLAGNVIAAPSSWSFTTASAIVGATIWADTSVPSVADQNDPSAIEVGTKFRSDVAGVVTGVRFYKGASNTGTHLGHLWDANGNLLGSVTFANETTNGWQEALFATPIPISANTTYVVSYYAPVGEYAADAGYFTGKGVDSGPLHALADGVDGGNGVYKYATGGGFPGNSFSGSNYWVDIVFNSTSQNTTPPTVTGETPLPGATSVAPNTTVTVTFSKAVQASTIGFTVTDPSGTAVPGSVSYNTATATATFTPTSALGASTVYTAKVSGVQDLAGNLITSPFVWSFTVADPTAPPAVNAETPAAGAAGVAKSTPITVTFSKTIEPTLLSFVVQEAAGNPIAGTVAYDAESNIATFTPNASLNAGTTYTAMVSNVQDLAGNTMNSPFTWSFTTAFALVGDTIWQPSATPQTASANDASPIEVGVKFTSDLPGYVTGVRFYKGAGNTGTHVGHLWDAAGDLLGSVTFGSETATGWQQANFTNPILIAPNSTYVISYYAPAGHYAADPGYFASVGADSTPLHALANGTAAGNGVYHYATGGGFPGSTYNSTNYWVDVVFTPQAATPTVSAETPAAGATGVSNPSITATFSEAVQANTISFVVKDPTGNTVPGSVSYNSATNTSTFTATGALIALTSYTATVSGAVDLSGNPMAAPFSWTFTTAGTTLFSPGAAPSLTAVNDPGAIELGVRFYSDADGFISGVRFYKGPGNTGTHLVHLWANDGTLLGTATVTNETATGWQQANFPTPIAISANTLYVASYYAPNGDYAATGGYFTTATNSGTLHAPANGSNGSNGLYRYGTGGGFPTNSYNSTNYWVDPIYTQTIGDTTPPTVTSVLPVSGSTAPTTTPISVTFSEDVKSTSISIGVTDSAGNIVGGTVTYNGTTRTATFQPNLPLSPTTTYTVTVSGVTDLSGNALASKTYAWSFKTGNTWVQSSFADFSAGTNNGTEVTNDGGGAVALAPLLEDNFGGSSLNSSAWATTSWTPYGGAATTEAVSNGVLSVNGAELLSVSSQTNTAVEGSINFAASPYQHFGLATDLGNVGGNYWAIFSTQSTTNQLFARVNANGATTDTDIGALPTGFHSYKIQPTSSGFQFYVDGVLEATIAAGFQTSQPLKAALSSFNGSASLQADWIKFDSYSTTQTGTFTSTVFDAGTLATWSTVSFDATTPTGTTLTVSYRSGTKQADGTILWSSWTQVSNGSSLTDQSGQALQAEYIQYQVTMTTTVASVSPALDDISFSWH
jgi:methionine-rich copper-binding protein CopC